MTAALAFAANVAFAQAPRGRTPDARPQAEAQAQSEAQPQRPPEATRPASEGLRPLPADSTTQHKMMMGGTERAFSATAGTVRLFDAQAGTPQADIAFIAYRLDGADVRSRPVTFAFNGGPGYASAWLHLGGLGPWRLEMDGAAAAPSAPTILIDNPETWLEFTDLVFLDPAGTGYSRILGNDDVRKSLWSVNGDANSLAVTIRRWVEANGRGASPKYIAGESYGGFRAPKIARLLQTDQGVGVDGLVLVAPVLDFRRFDSSDSLFQNVARLPSYAATARERKGPISRNDLKDVEEYAAGDYLVDLVKGVNDKAAMARIVQKVAGFTGLEPALVARLGGRIPADVFAREINRDDFKISSGYDANVTSFDPFPQSSRGGGGDDQLRLGLHAPLVQAMVDLYQTRLNWKVENGRYMFLNEQAGRQWEGRREAESIGDLRRILALDPRLRVLVTHGLTDIVTPYFETKMLLDQTPDFGGMGRVRFRTYPGGHMSYIRQATRKTLRDDVRALVEGK